MLYRHNPIIMIPSIILAIVNLILATMLLSVIVSLSELVGLVISLLVIAVNILVTFLVVFGLAGMTGRIVLEGHTSIRDWGSSIKTRFRVILGLGIIFGSVFILSSTITIGVVASLAPLVNSFNIFRITPIVRDIVSTILLSLLYIVLAPAIMEGKGIRDSMRHDLRAVRNGLGVYLSYLGTLIVVSLVISIIPIPIEGSIANIVTEGVRAVSSPFLFIMAFLIYWNKRNVFPSTWS